MSACGVVPVRGLISDLLARSMTDGLIRAQADWATALRARITELGITHAEVDHRAGLAEGHTNKIVNGKKKPTTVTLERLCGALALAFAPVVDAAREEVMRPHWVKRRR